MSGETYITGYITFKKGTPKEVIEEIKYNLLELDQSETTSPAKIQVVENHESFTMDFTHLNWVSHVDESKIKTIELRYKQYIRRGTIMYYPLLPTYTWDYDETSEVEKVLSIASKH